MDEVFLDNLFSPNPGPLGCQGWVVIPINVKKPKSLHPSVNTKEACAAPGGVYITGA